jgi:5-methylcytosine-specific restriction endonuclease McrA
MAVQRKGRPYRRNRQLVIAASGGVCALCGLPLGSRVHVDHIRPVVFGGTDAVSNMRATHPSCNMRRGVKPGPDDRVASRQW